MFVAMFVLLNRYVPDVRDGILVEAATVQKISGQKDGSAERVDVNISPVAQRVSRVELNRLDKNQYVINQELGVALPQPPDDNWSIATVDSIETVSVYNIPALQITNEPFKAVFEEIKANPILALQEKKGHTLVLNAASEVAGVRMDLNPFLDRATLRRSMEAQLKLSASITGEAFDPEAVEKAEKAIGSQLSDGFEKKLKAVLPVTKNIRNGVYVATFEIKRGPEDNWLVKLTKDDSPLDRALRLDNLQLTAMRNLKVDQAQGIASFEVSQRLRKVVVDGVETDATLNVLGFVVAAADRIVLVQLQSLDTGQGLSTALFLKRVVDKLYFVMAP